MVKNTTNLMLFKNSNPVYKIYQTDDFADIKPLEYKVLSGAYRIQKPERKYIVFTEPGEWTLVGSTKLEGRPVNAWEYGTGTEIRRENTLLLGYFISIATLILLATGIKSISRTGAGAKAVI